MGNRLALTKLNVSAIQWDNTKVNMENTSTINQRNYWKTEREYTFVGYGTIPFHLNPEVTEPVGIIKVIF